MKCYDASGQAVDQWVYDLASGQAVGQLVYLPASGQVLLQSKNIML